MLVVIHVCEKDLHSALRNIEWCLTLDGRSDLRCLISHERTCNVALLAEKCATYFSAVDDFSYDPWRGDPEWPKPQNNAWQETARFIESRYKSPWFWWEQDAIPLKPGWLALLNEAHRQGGRIVSGPVAQHLGMHYIAGVAIYPWNCSHAFHTAMLTMAQPWDIIASARDGILRKAHDLSALICHVPDKQSVRFESRDDIVRLIPESAVLFHKCKDGSLLDVLQGRVLEDEPGVNHSDLSDVPSFTEQTPWPSGLFTFPPASQTCHFNCSVCESEGSQWLFTRRFRYSQSQVMGGGVESSLNDLAIWRIRKNMTLEPGPIIPYVPNRFPHEQWEDPRVMMGDDGRAYVSFATWVHFKNWAIRQSFTRLTPDWRRIEVLWEAPFGGNARKPDIAKSHEKNWVWFQRDGVWHCVYMPNPHTVFSVDDQGTPLKVYTNRKIGVPWEHGELRGGTPPVKVGDEYLCFFHSSVTWQKPKRRYFMGAYTFSAEPPFEFLRMTSEPLLIGSEKDFRVLGGPLVVFPNGALLKDGIWTVVFGINDEGCGWVKIPHVELDAKLEVVGRKRGALSKLVDLAKGV